MSQATTAEGLAETAKTVWGEAPPVTAPVTFTYKAPSQTTKRAVINLVASDVLVAAIQQFTGGGGEKNLHSHDALEGFWFVLAGRAIFYGPGNQVIGELGPHEGVLVPRGVAYWFEQMGEEPLQILQVEAIDKAAENNTRFYGEVQAEESERFTPDGQFIRRSKLQLARLKRPDGTSLADPPSG